MGTRRARNALIAAAALIVVCLAAAKAPPSWSAVLPLRPTLLEAGPAGPVWTALADLLPVGELAWRADVLAALFCGLCALAAAWASYQLFRGPGRWVASVAVGPIITAALLGWARDVGPAEALRMLPPTLVGTLAVAWTVRSLVHFGFVTPVARTRAVGAAAVVAVFEPRMGLPLLLAVAAGGYALGRQRRLVGGTVVVAVVPAAIAFAALWITGAYWTLPDLTSLRLAAPDLDPFLGGHLPTAGAYAGLALVLLLVMPLRWRGGLVLVVLTAGGLFLHDRHGSLAPTPALLMLLGSAAAGWIWLAGSAAPKAKPWVGRVLAVAATPAAAFVALSQGALGVTPVAASRTTASLHRLYEKGLVAPGDTLVTYGAWTRTIQEARYAQGWRPDVECTAGDGLSPDALMEVVMEVDARNRRLLSNSWSGGGNWSAEWMLDSGPLFWLVGPGLAPEEREFTDLTRFVPELGSLPEAERAQWVRMVVERARFRRALGEPAAALEAMPLSSESHRGMHTRLQLATNARPSAGRESELPALSGPLPADPRAVWAAEGGDLLFAYGERERASELLAEAGAAGHPSALAALARWQFRAGEDEAARQTVAAMAGNPTMRSDALAMVGWLLARQRTADAAHLLGALTLADRPTMEIGARLEVLTAHALLPPPTPPEPDPETVTRR
jgi:hypothetical protein